MCHRQNDPAEAPEEQSIAVGSPRSCSRYAIQTETLSQIELGAHDFESSQVKAAHPKTSHAGHYALSGDHDHGTGGGSR